MTKRPAARAPTPPPAEVVRPRAPGPPYVPHEEYAYMMEALRKVLHEGPGRGRKLVVKRWLIDQQRLNVLAEHQATKVDFSKHGGPTIARVTVEFRTEDKPARVAKAIVTALGPIQGRTEAYTPETLPAQVGGAEKTSEGVRGVDELTSADKRGNRK